MLHQFIQNNTLNLDASQRQLIWHVVWTCPHWIPVLQDQSADNIVNQIRNSKYKQVLCNAEEINHEGYQLTLQSLSNILKYGVGQRGSRRASFNMYSNVSPTFATKS